MCDSWPGLRRRFKSREDDINILRCLLPAVFGLSTFLRLKSQDDDVIQYVSITDIVIINVINLVFSVSFFLPLLAC